MVLKEFNIDKQRWKKEQQEQQQQKNPQFLVYA